MSMRNGDGPMMFAMQELEAQERAEDRDERFLKLQEREIALKEKELQLREVNIAQLQKTVEATHALAQYNFQMLEKICIALDIREKLNEKGKRGSIGSGGGRG